MKTLKLLLITASIFFTSSVLGKERVDLDTRFLINDNNRISQIQKRLLQQKIINILGEPFTVIHSLDETFLDYYFDTPALKFFNSNASFRLRKRFISGKLSKQLLQYKYLKNSGDKGFVEKKQELDLRTVFDSSGDLIAYLERQKSGRNSFVVNLDKIINIRSLLLSTKILQSRDRYYFQHSNNKKIYFTVTFDTVLFEKNLATDMENFVELEISEKMLKRSSADEAAKLMKKINWIKKEFFPEDIPYEKSKYQRSIERLKVRSLQKDIYPAFWYAGFIILLTIFAITLWNRTTRHGR